MTNTAHSVKDRLAQVIGDRREQMALDLARHVAIPTGKNYTQGLEEYRGLIVERLVALGATADVFPGDGRPDWMSDGDHPFVPPPTVVCRRGEPSILLAGHLDTVFDPQGSFLDMEVSADGARAVGPGVVDMKGGILIAVVALEALSEVGIDVPWSFLLSSDEETGSYASARILGQQARQHRWGLALEPALPDGSLAIERKGSGQFKIECFGRSAHAGREFDKGVSAVYELARALQQVEQLCDPERGVTVNVGPLVGGVATNIVPDYAAAWGNVRYPDNADADRLGAQMEAMATGGDSIPRVVVHKSFNRPAKPLIPEVQRLAELAREVAESLGQHLPFASTGGVCDGNILQAEGLPTIDTLGVRGGGLHTQSEWIELGSLTERATLLACLIVRLSEL